MSSLDPTPSRVAARGRDPATGVYYKLALFSVALFVAPLAAFYFAKDKYLNGNATYAGGLAAVVVNLVLAGYIVTAFLEDDGSSGESASTKTTSTPNHTVNKKKKER